MIHQLRRRHAESGRALPVFLGVLVVFLGIAVAAAFTKPDREHFEEWYVQHLQDQEEVAPDDYIGGIVERAKSAVLGLQGKFTVKYEDQVVFATATVTQGQTEPKFIGFFGNWYQISSN